MHPPYYFFYIKFLNFISSTKLFLSKFYFPKYPDLSLFSFSYNKIMPDKITFFSLFWHYYIKIFDFLQYIERKYTSSFYRSQSFIPTFQVAGQYLPIPPLILKVLVLIPQFARKYRLTSYNCWNIPVLPFPPFFLVFSVLPQ